MGEEFDYKQYRKKESKVQTEILRGLERIPRSAWTKIEGANRSGVTDIVGHVSGHFIGIEVKRVGESPRPLQDYRIQKLRQSGAFAFVADSWRGLKDELLRCALIDEKTYGII
jgi:hypothetical protein